ncbi:hypothetical protein [Pseudocnuella soli]|uniref:hypothetical protein n=1 Tax=Pseudocnuella soli TaxID=2502779 RepID=UPI001047615D|nr:hypothetical protein [Pseudocnuella soli]
MKRLQLGIFNGAEQSGSFVGNAGSFGQFMRLAKNVQTFYLAQYAVQAFNRVFQRFLTHSRLIQNQKIAVVVFHTAIIFKKAYHPFCEGQPQLLFLLEPV